MKNKLKEIEDFGISITVSEAAEILGIKPNTITAYISREQIDKKYLRKSGVITLISIEYIKERLKVKHED